jgi:hypothetical protein
MKLKNKEVAVSAVVVVCFWWVILALGSGKRPDIPHIGAGMAWVLAGCAIGVLIQVIFLKLERAEVEEVLVNKPVRGLFSTIGPVPVHLTAPPSSKVMPEDAETKSFIPSEVEAAGALGFVSEWRTQFAAWSKPYDIGTGANVLHCVRAGPAYVRLFDDVLKTFWAPEHRDLPATHATDPRHNHGGRSLITHSMLVAWLMVNESKRYTYKPAKKGGFSLIKLRDNNYVFDAKDPLIAIIGLAHDIGKLECFEFEDGRVVGCKQNHDMVGARIMARFDSFWNDGISQDDRLVMQLVMAHYHHPSATPMTKDNQVISDRLHALLELLIQCDRIASAIENGANINVVREQVKNDELFDADPSNKSTLEEAILEILMRSTSINSSNNDFNVGFKFSLKQYHKTIVVLKEDDFAKAVAKKAGMENLIEKKTGGSNPVSEMARRINRYLADEGVLFTDHDSTANRSPDSSFFSVKFYTAKQYFVDGKTQDEPKSESLIAAMEAKFQWGSTILISPDANAKFHFLSSLPDHPALIPHIGHARTGAAGKTKRKSLLDPSDVSSAGQGDDGDTDMQPPNHTASSFLQRLAAQSIETPAALTQIEHAPTTSSDMLDDPLGPQTPIKGLAASYAHMLPHNMPANRRATVSTNEMDDVFGSSTTLTADPDPREEPNTSMQPTPSETLESGMLERIRALDIPNKILGQTTAKNPVIHVTMSPSGEFRMFEGAEAWISSQGVYRGDLLQFANKDLLESNGLGFIATVSKQSGELRISIPV